MAAETLTGVVYLRYPGLSENEKLVRRAKFRPNGKTGDGFQYPRTPKLDYHDRKNDNEADLARKDARRAKYRAERLTELEDEVYTLDAVRAVGGVVFRKGELTEVDLDGVGVLAEDADKLRSWVRQGLLQLVGEEELAAPEAKPRRKKAKPVDEEEPSAIGAYVDQPAS